MSLWAIVPVKPLLEGKSRLAKVLSPVERAALSRAMLGGVLDVLAQIPGIHRTLVISRDPAALAAARRHNAQTVTESGSPSLNAALHRATQVARAFDAERVLILPSDLPMVTAADVEALLHCAEADHQPAIVIAPDRRGDGTNALLTRPPGLIEYAFGQHSFSIHLDRAHLAGLEPRIHQSTGLGLDLDLPEDLDLWRRLRSEAEAAQRGAAWPAQPDAPAHAN